VTFVDIIDEAVKTRIGRLLEIPVSGWMCNLNVLTRIYTFVDILSLAVDSSLLDIQLRTSKHIKFISTYLFIYGGCHIHVNFSKTLGTGRKGPNSLICTSRFFKFVVFLKNEQKNLADF
jgi:hypothetical protein